MTSAAPHRRRTRPFGLNDSLRPPNRQQRRLLRLDQPMITTLILVLASSRCRNMCSAWHASSSSEHWTGKSVIAVPNSPRREFIHPAVNSKHVRYVGVDSDRGLTMVLENDASVSSTGNSKKRHEAKFRKRTHNNSASPPTNGTPHYAKKRRQEGAGRRRKKNTRPQKKTATTNLATKRFNQKLDSMCKSIHPNRNRDEGIATANKMEKIVFDALNNWEHVAANSKDLSNVVRPETKTFNILINAIGRTSYPDSALRAEQMLETMFKLQKTHGYAHLAPDSFSFTAVMSALSRWANRSRKNAKSAAMRVMELLSHMEGMTEENGSSTVAPTAVTFNTVLDVLAKTGNVKDAERAEALLERMKQMFESGSNVNARPTVISYNACMKGYARCAGNRVADAPDRAEALLQQMKDDGIFPDRITYTTLIDTYAKAATFRPGAAERAEEILRDMTHIAAISGDNAVLPDYLTYSAVIQAWARTATMDAASRASSLLAQMEALHASGTCKGQGVDLAPNTITYNTVLNAIAKSGHPDAAQQAWDLLMKMQRLSKLKDRDVKCDTITFSTVIDAIAKSGADPERAEELFFRMEKEYKDTGDESFRPNTITLSSVVNSWAKNGDPDTAASRTLALLDRAEQIHHLRPNAIVYSTLLECLAKSRSREAAKAAEDVIKRMERLYRDGKKEARPDAAAYANLINAYTKSGSANSNQRALELLNDAIGQYEKGNEAMKPTLLLYSATLQALAKSATVGGAEKAEALLRSKLYFRSRPKMTTVCFNAVIDAHARSGAPDAAERAEAILDEMIERYEKGDIEVKPSVRSFNAAMLAWKNSKDPNAPKRAEAILKRMNDVYQESGDTSVKPDICTINTIIGTWANLGTKEAAEKAMAFLLYAEGRQAVGDLTMKPDRITFRSCVEAWANSGDKAALKKALEVAKRMEASPHKPDLVTLHSLMRAYYILHRPGKPPAAWRPTNKAGAAELQAETFLGTMLSEYEAGLADADLVGIAFDVLIRAYEQNGDDSAMDRAEELRRQKDVVLTEEKDTADDSNRNKWNLSRRVLDD